MNSAPDLVELGRVHIESAHELILVGALLGVMSIFAGLLSRRFGAPVLLVFLVLGMLAGEDGPGGIAFDDFYYAYLIGSIALAVILFEGGLKTHLSMVRLAFWPALVLAVIGVGITAGIVAVDVMLRGGVPFVAAMLVGAAVAPTDASAVNTLLRRARLALPDRVTALLEVESGLNDPMSIFLTIMVILLLLEPALVTPGHAAWLFVKEMAGGAIIGLAGGAMLDFLLRRLKMESATSMVLVLTFALALFGFAQVLGTSGFLAVYIAGLVTGATEHRAHQEVEYFIEGIAWLAQIILFLMLGMLVTPHDLIPYIPAGMLAAAVLIVIARPVAVFACLLPFGFTLRESAFASWVGLRGAVPIYISIMPALADPRRDSRLFAVVFVMVVVSLVVQGWTIVPAARLLGFGRKDS